MNFNDIKKAIEEKQIFYCHVKELGEDWTHLPTILKCKIFLLTDRLENVTEVINEILDRDVNSNYILIYNLEEIFNEISDKLYPISKLKIKYKKIENL